VQEKLKLQFSKLTEQIGHITPIKFSGSYLAKSPGHTNLCFKNLSLQLNSTLRDKGNN